MKDTSKFERRFLYPDFVTIFHNSSIFSQNKIAVLKDLTNSGYILSDFFLIGDFTDTYKVCLVCEYKYHVTRLIYLDKPVTSKHSVNFNGDHIETDLREEERNLVLRSCDRMATYKVSGLPQESEKCLIQMLSEKYNFTFRRLPVTKPMIIKRQPMSKYYMDTVVIPEMRHVLEYANGLHPWAFIVVQPRTEGLEAAFTEIFDFTLWFCLLALYISMRFSAVLSLTLIRFKYCPALNKYHGLLKVFANLIDHGLYQGIKPYIHRWKHIRLHMLNKLLWGFTIGTLVNLSYRAKLASTLTQTVQPSTPNQFETLANSTLNIYTFVIVPRKTGLRSLILDTLEDLASDFKEQQQKMPIEYRNFQKALKYFPLYLPGMQKFVSMLHIQLNRNLKIGETFPKTFAVFEPQRFTPMIKELIELFVPQMWVSSMVIVNKFLIVAPYTMESNYMYPVLKKGVARISESGLFDRWNDYYYEMLSLENIRKTQDLIDKSSGNFTRDKKLSSTLTKNWFGYLDSVYGTNNQRERMVLNKPLSIGDLMGVFVVSGIAHLSLIIFLVVEKVFYNNVRFSNFEYRF